MGNGQTGIVPIPKKGDLRDCSNYRTISLIGHPSKVLLKVILNRLSPQVEEVLTEEQAGFRKRRSTVEQIFNVRILCEKYRDHGKSVFHSFVDFNKAFDRVWQQALWLTMKKHNIEPNLIRMVESLYANTSCSVMFDGNIGHWFRTTVGLRQGCLLSPCLFNLFLEQIMTKALENHEGSISVGGRTISNLRFADDIDLLAGSTKELEDLTKNLDKASLAHGMEISGEKTKVLVNPGNKEDSTVDMDICVGDTRLEQVRYFKYLGAHLTEDCTSTHEVKKRLAIATQKLAKMKKIWRCKIITFKVKVNLLRAVITTTALYGCESWTLSSSLENKIQAFEMRCFRRLLGIPYTAHRTNDSVKQQVEDIIGAYEPLLETARRRKLQWFGHISRQCGTLSNTILQGCVEGKRNQGRPKINWMTNVTSWTGMSAVECHRLAENREMWRNLVHNAKTPLRPSTATGL